MSIVRELEKRSRSSCELCTATEKLAPYEITPSRQKGAEDAIFICETCSTQIEDPEQMNPNHWRCLNDSIWSEVTAVQIMAWRMLNRLKTEGWPQDLLDMLYLDEDILKWANATGEGDDDSDIIKHIDSNGEVLQAGDNVVLIKDLNVKGANFTAKRGTAVRRISLTHDNPEHIEGKIDGQHIVILTKFVKKLS